MSGAGSGRIVPSGDSQTSNDLSFSPPRRSGIHDPSFSFPAGAQGFKKPDYVIVAPQPSRRRCERPPRPREETCAAAGFDPTYREGDLTMMYRQAEMARARARRDSELRDCQRPNRRIEGGYIADVSDSETDIENQGWAYYTNPIERPYNPLQ